MRAPSPIGAIEPGRLVAQYRALGLDGLSDLELFRSVAASIAHPKLSVDSFVLHAPLEILARYRLLPFVHPSRRELARLRLIAVAARYAAAGPSAEVKPVTEAAPSDLMAAIEAGDADRAQAVAALISHAQTPSQLTAKFATAFLRRLGAAAHGHLFFYLTGSVESEAGQSALTLLPNFARELAVDYQQRLEWTAPGIAPEDNGQRSVSFDLAALERALLTSPLKPFRGFLYPIMHAAERANIPQSVVGDLLRGPMTDEAADRAFASVCRAAALSMLQESPNEAKYGWTHALDLPLGAWLIAPAVPDRAFAARVAATYFLSLRAALGKKKRLSAVPDLIRTDLPLSAALTKSPAAAAASAWRIATECDDRVFADLATEASIRGDAHLVKYVLACHDAAKRDPSPVYSAAAAHLAALWMREEPIEVVENQLRLM